jgi:AcrR family transcriptional regulator
MAGTTDERQLRQDGHDQSRRQQILDAAIGVLADSAPGTGVHVQQVADRAGLSRADLERHFADRADLDAAVRGRGLELLRAHLVPMLSFDRTPIVIIRRVVLAYVEWASEHPALHELVHQDPHGPGIGQMDQAIGRLAGQLEDLVDVGVELLHLRLPDHEVAALDPLVFGLVGGVVSSTRRWLSRPEPRPEQPVFVELVTEAVWFQVAGLARGRGVELDPEVPLDLLLEAALDGAAG